MEINVPTASPFFTGIPNQIMYCISTPAWSTTNGATYNNELIKKPENASSIVQPQPIAVSTTTQLQPNQPPQYYYGTPATIQQNPPSVPSTFNQAYPVQPAVTAVAVATVNNQANSNTEAKNAENYVDSKTTRDTRFFEEDGRNYECAVCQKKFRQKGTLVQHERIHLDSKPYQCPHCEKRFRQKAILNQHVRIHSDASAQLIYMNLGSNQGTLWPQNVPYPEEIRNEKLAINEKETVQIVHSIFGNTQEENNKEETRNLQKIAMPQFVRCPICQQEFKQKSTLVQRGCIHIESRPYSCLVLNCGKRFRQQSHLQQHNRIHTNSKPYKCPYQECQKFFRQQTILNQHIRVHTGLKPYSCKTCFKEFRQQAILTQHEKSHMNSTFGCPLTNCKRRFVTENDLKKHINEHMNPTKSKKQSSKNNSDLKPEISFTHHQASPYIYFNATSIHQQQQQTQQRN